MKKYKVGIIGATGMVGQRFTLLLENHPWGLRLLFLPQVREVQAKHTVKQLKADGI